jgi:PAS domain S-box-containing protein
VDAFQGDGPRGSRGPEAQRQAADSLYRSLFELSMDPAVVHNGKVVLDLNPAAAEFFGFDDMLEPIGMSVEPFIHPDHRDRVAKATRAALAGEVPPQIREVLVRKDGTPVTVDTVRAAITYEGEPAVFLVIRDLTNVLAAEEAIKASEERYRLLFEQSPDPTVVHDGARVVAANRAAYEFANTDPDEGLGQAVSSFLTPHSQMLVAGRIQHMLRTGQAQPNIEIEIRAAGKGIRIAEVSSRPVSFDGKMAIQSVFRDLTERRQTEAELKRYRRELERMVRERTEQLAEVKSELDAIMAVIMRTVELRDPYTAGHQRRVAELVGRMAAAMGLGKVECDRIGIAARIHDIGKVSVPAEILSKPGRLSEAEYALVKVHAQSTADILLSVELDWPLAGIALQHHERMDGSGYPNGLVGEEILPLARLLSVADVVEAMSSHRPYRPALGVAAALTEIRQNAGTLYDLRAVGACEQVFAEGFRFEN